MNGTKNLDVRGLSCPEPALRTRLALQGLGTGTLVVLVDSSTSRNNVERTGRQLGWQTQALEEGATTRITLRK
ncbi:MAG: SirA family protein [Planctomycetes bacterium]|nr:SirA family protein [Planctomycetota bacterium]